MKFLACLLSVRPSTARTHCRKTKTRFLRLSWCHWKASFEFQCLQHSWNFHIIDFMSRAEFLVLCSADASPDNLQSCYAQEAFRLPLIPNEIHSEIHIPLVNCVASEIYYILIVTLWHERKSIKRRLFLQLVAFYYLTKTPHPKLNFCYFLIKLCFRPSAA